MLKRRFVNWANDAYKNSKQSEIGKLNASGEIAAHLYFIDQSISSKCLMIHCIDE